MGKLAFWDENDEGGSEREEEMSFVTFSLGLFG